MSGLLDGAALQKAIDARRELDDARVAVRDVLAIVPLGRHASPDECDEIRKRLRAIMTGAQQ